MYFRWNYLFVTVINFNRSVVVNSYYVDDNDDSYTRNVKIVLNPEVWMNSALRVAYHNSVSILIIHNLSKRIVKWFLLIVLIIVLLFFLLINIIIQIIKRINLSLYYMQPWWMSLKPSSDVREKSKVVHSAD